MSTPQWDRTPALTDRERSILTLMGRGRTAAQIAARLQMSTHTVTDHKRSIYVKLGARSQSHAISRAISLGLLDPTGTGMTAHPPAGLTVVTGPPGCCLDEVTHTLCAHDERYILAPADSEWSPPDHTNLVVVLVDPDDAAWALPRDLDAPAVVVHSTTTDDAATIAAVLRGAYALVSRADVRTDLSPVLALARHGYRTLSPENARLVASWAPTLAMPGPMSLVPELTDREREILVSIAHGDTVTQTARSLGIATKTVENLQTRLFRKLGTRNRAETLVVAYRSGLLDR